MTKPDTAKRANTHGLLDEYLVLAAQNGDRRALADLVRRWQRRLHAHAWRLTGEDEAAKDAVQAAWLEIARSLGSLRDERAFPVWAYRIVSRRCARDIAATRLRRNLALAAAIEPEPPPIQPDLEARDESARLHAALKSLPSTQRAAVALFHFEELSIAEIAVALDVPAGTVKTRLMHARRALRAVLEGDRNA